MSEEIQNNMVKNSDLDGFVKLSIVLACFSVVYYFLISKPSLDKEKFNYERQLEQSKEEKMQIERKINKEKLEECLRIAALNYVGDWNLNCKKFGTDRKTDGCTLSRLIADNLQSDFAREKEACHKWYGNDK